MHATLDAPALAQTGESPAPRWGGRILTGLPVLFMALDAVIKLVHIPEVAEASAQLGWPDRLNPTLAVMILLCLALYLWPRTAVLGATLFTGYLGGAVAIHARVGDPLLTHTLFPVYVGGLLWVGLYLRDAGLRALLSTR
jgi:hypothetical protein